MRQKILDEIQVSTLLDCEHALNVLADSLAGTPVAEADFQEYKHSGLLRCLQYTAQSIASIIELYSK
jgi:hypothetical protein